MTGWLIFTLIAIVIAAAVYAQHAAQKRRTHAWQRTAEELGLQFLPENPLVLDRFGHLRLLKQGQSRRMRNVIYGNAGDTEISVGDFQYTTGSGKNRRTHVYTVCILESDDLRLPHCFLRPEVRFFDFLGGLFGGQDIDFADDSEFSAGYVLQADNEQAARRLFDADVRSYFAARKTDRLNFEVSSGALVFHSHRRLKPEQARDLMQQALEIKQLLAARQTEADKGT